VGVIYLFIMKIILTVIKKEKIRNTLVNAKRPLCTPEGHLVLYVGHNSNIGVLANGQSNGCIVTFPYYRSTFKRRALLS